MSFPTSLFGDDLGDEKWHGGALAHDGCIYAAPCNSRRILKIDPKKRTAELVDPILPDGGEKYCGAVAAKNKCVYFIPDKAEQVLKFDVQTQEGRFVGNKYDTDNASKQTKI